MHSMEHNPDGHVSPSRRPEQSALQRESSSTSRTECEETWMSLPSDTASPAVRSMIRPGRARPVQTPSAPPWALARAAGNCYPAPKSEGEAVVQCMCKAFIHAQRFWAEWPRLFIPLIFGSLTCSEHRSDQQHEMLRSRGSVGILPPPRVVTSHVV